MLPDKKVRCHRLDRTCHNGVVAGCCQLWTNVRGRDPQTGDAVDRWGCADAFVPMLLVEIAQKSAQTGAAIESFRNETVRAAEAAAQNRNDLLTRLIPDGPSRMIGSN